jgi:hypothetical protein
MREMKRQGGKIPWDMKRSIGEMKRCEKNPWEMKR